MSRQLHNAEKQATNFGESAPNGFEAAHWPAPRKPRDVDVNSNPMRDAMAKKAKKAKKAAKKTAKKTVKKAKKAKKAKKK